MRTATQRIESLKENLDPSEQIRMGRDERAREEYSCQMPEDRRPLARSVNLNRKEETLLIRLRANCETSLMEARHRFGTSSSPTCPHCGLDPETAEHYITSCSQWAEARLKSLCERVSVDVPNQPDKILDFAILTELMSPNQ